MRSTVLTMQDVLLRLTEYWASRGCVIAQPMNTEVGAGTLNPATFLRVLGPEPWRVAYVEPSVRPDDSRYGDNPNRLQTHTQFQVILKPEPGDPQELYLESLRALGIDDRAHDIRFVEDNWASPAIGAWGLGWEVWLDGLEITQFTYFQQAGGFSLDPVSVELTYGVERIVMALQGVNHFKDVRYAPGVSFGEAFGQAEYEMSRYYLDDADIATNRTLFEAYESEARRLLEGRLPVPAYTYLLKCSHTFNVLDARGAVGTAERARAFARMRALAHGVAGLWIERREELGYPLGVAETPAVSPPAELSSSVEIASPSDFLLEIGFEELPAAEVERTTRRVGALLEELLRKTRLRHGSVRTVGSPRRVAAVVKDVEPRERASESVVRGPRLQAAYDTEGRPTPAASGFARKQGVAVEDLRRVTSNGEEHVGVVTDVPGRAAAEVLSDVVRALLSGLRAEHNMRWNAPGLSFSRPIRWLVALLGDQVVPLSISTLHSGRFTRVHRHEPMPLVQVDSAAEYLPTLERHEVIADAERRREIVSDESRRLAGTVHGVVDLPREASLVDEIVNLVELPVGVIGTFDQRFLELPAEVLMTVMRKHQRYLPVRDHSGALLPHFVAFANGDCDREVVRSGNESVLRARYEDAAFFWHQDLHTTPESMKGGLSSLVFEERLGTMADRASRIEAIALDLTRGVQLDSVERRTLQRAGALVKFDLGSRMVTELPSLAGTMAREYARRSGEDERVVVALYEMELPRHAGDSLPESAPGALLALADRFDLLAGLFAIGSAPTGSVDPYGLRRAALGVVGILRRHPRLAHLSICDGLAAAGRRQPVPLDEPAAEATVRFVLRRFEHQLLDAGFAFDVVQAVLPLAERPSHAVMTAEELSQLRDDASFAKLKTAIQRVQRIVPAETPATYDEALFEFDAERHLHEALGRVRADLGKNAADLRHFVALAEALVEPIDRFFVDVLVIAEDPAVRANRLGLLASVNEVAAGRLAWEALS